MNWLMNSDPSIRWQAMRDLADEPDAVVSAERARVATEGWGAELIAMQAPEGGWGDTPEPQTWIETRDGSVVSALTLLRHMGIDPMSEEARGAVTRVREKVRHTNAGQPFFDGEVEPCVNGMVLAIGAYFGEASESLADRLLGEQLQDGGWNCDAPPSERSSFHSTICILEGLLEYERSGGSDPAVTPARARGDEYMLQRRMFRSLSTGEVIEHVWKQFAFPTSWHYDILRGLEYLRAAGHEPDDRTSEAIEIVERNRDDRGRWPLQNPHPGLDEHEKKHWRLLGLDSEEAEGRPSAWNTLRALRVLRWAGRDEDL